MDQTIERDELINICLTVREFWTFVGHASLHACGRRRIRRRLYPCKSGPLVPRLYSCGFETRVALLLVFLHFGV